MQSSTPLGPDQVNVLLLFVSFPPTQYLLEVPLVSKESFDLMENAARPEDKCRELFGARARVEVKGWPLPRPASMPFRPFVEGLGHSGRNDT
jgi:hypothetical protein